jgi:hypothetical protein
MQPQNCSVNSVSPWFVLWLVLSVPPAFAAPRVEVKPDEAARRVDVTVDGKPFTAYIWPASLEKPVLWPILTAAGTPVTRGFPLDPKPGESTDHPHHVGLWLNFGDVNGSDFWNHCKAVPSQQGTRYGTIVHTRIARSESGDGRGALEVEAEWLNSAGDALLRETTRYDFHAGEGRRVIDRATTLTAAGKPVVFKDNKEGMFGLRLARFLEHPGDRPVTVVGPDGRPAAEKVLDNSVVTGRYRSSEGIEGIPVWGTRARWMLLSGRSGDEAVALAILDHPSNPEHPAYWHARGYGLFAVNPLGRRVFDKSQPELITTVAAGQSIAFRFRVLVLSGSPDAAGIESEYTRFAK